MRAHKLILSSLVIPVLLSSCSGGAQQATPSSRSFPEVRIPSMYTDSHERQQYAAVHFWDRFLSADDSGWRTDSTMVLGVSSDEVESKFATFISILESGPIETAREVSGNLFSALEARQKADTSSNVLGHFSSLMEKYLYDSNSPYRNEDIYCPFVKGLSESDLTPESMKPAYSHDAMLCSLNSIGSVAADFVFRDVNGRNRNLHGIKGEYTLLFFSNPGCSACKEIIELLSMNFYVGSMISSGRLAVVNVYIDEDLDAWREYLPNYPKEWYSGYDPGYVIRGDILYSVRAIPSLYLLDSEKRVIMKDATEDNVLGYLSSVAGR